VTSNATSDLIEQILVWPLDAGVWPDAVVRRVSTGVQSAERPTTPPESVVVTVLSLVASVFGAHAVNRRRRAESAADGVRMGNPEECDSVASMDGAAVVPGGAIHGPAGAVPSDRVQPMA
jgi:hypothetical protein